MAAMFVYFSLAGFAAILGLAAFQDIRTGKVANGLSLGLVGLFGVFSLSGLPIDQFFMNFAVGAAALIIGIGIFAMNWAGGADVKLTAAVALWCGPSLILPFLFVTALAGGAIALIVVLNSRWFGIAGNALPFEVHAGFAEKRQIPYALAIAVGGAFVGARLVAGLSL